MLCSESLRMDLGTHRVINMTFDGTEGDVWVRRHPSRGSQYAFTPRFDNRRLGGTVPVRPQSNGAWTETVWACLQLARKAYSESWR